jgi:hypothetical protein
VEKMERKTLYGFIKKCMDDGIKPGQTAQIIKAATDYEISGALEPTDALTLADTVRQRANVVSQMRLVPCSSNLVNLNQITNEGVLVGRAGAVTAKSAILAGNDVANISKGNIGNQVTLRELYFLFSRLYEEMTNTARLGADAFNRWVSEQFQTSYMNVLEDHVWYGDNGANEPRGLMVSAKANLGDGSTGKTVRNVNNAAYTTVLESLRGLRDIMSDKYRNDVVYFMSLKNLDTYRDEVASSSSFSSKELLVENKQMIFDGRPIIASPYITEGEFLASPLDNMCWCVNTTQMSRDVEVQNVPKSMLYSIVAFWNFEFATYDKVAIAFDQS